MVRLYVLQDKDFEITMTLKDNKKLLFETIP